MFPNERREKIKEKITTKEKVFVSELSNTLGVTEETIRRDLEKLEKEGLLTRNYGGAVLNKESLRDYPLYMIRENTHIKEKKVIAKKALELVKDGYTVMADSSSTSVYAIKACHKTRNITVISNSARLLNCFQEQSGLQIISTGGVYAFDSMSFVGSIPESFVKNYNVDIAFISCKGIHKTKGITDSNETERNFKRYLAMQADKVCLLVDSSKFSKVGFIKSFDYREIDCLITDQEPINDWKEFLESQDIQVL